MIYPEGQRRPPRTGLIIAVTAVVCLLIGGAAVFLFTGNSTPEAAPATPTTGLTTTSATNTSTNTVSSAPSVSVEPPAVAAADGCLGGSDPFTALAAAQAAAPLDDQGAAAFALAFARWSVTFPIDPNAADVLPRVARAGQAGANFTKVTVKALNENARQLREKGYTQAVTAYDKGEYRIVGGSGTNERDGRDIQLTLYRELTKADGTTEEIKMTTTVMVTVQDKAWRIVGSPVEGQIDPADPTFTWLPYTGTC